MLEGLAPGATHAELLGDVEAGRQGVLMEAVAAVAAAEVAVGLAILMMVYRNSKSSDINILNKLKW